MSRVSTISLSAVLPLIASIISLASGCRTSAGIREATDAEGFPVCVDLKEEGEGDSPPSVVAERLREHVNRTNLAPQPGLQPAIAAPAHTTHFDPFVERDCPPEGSASTEKKAKSNRLKNRTRLPEANDIDPHITLNALRTPGNDVNRWSSGLAGTIEGYVRAAKGTGQESCNCRASAKRLTHTHLDIVAGPDDHRKSVIAEITPVMRLIHEHSHL